MAHINWLSVYNHFVSSESVTLADCATKFNIHVDYVRQVAAKQGWTAKKLQIKHAALQEVERKAVDLLAKRSEEHAQLGKALQLKAIQALATDNFNPKSFDDIRKGLETGIRIERQALDMDKREAPSVAIQNNFNSFHTQKPNGVPFEIQWGNGESLGTFAYNNGSIENLTTNDTY